MPERADLHLVDGITGEAQDSAYTGLTLPELIEALVDKERKLIGAGLEIGRLKKELAGVQAAEADAEHVKEVLLYWRPRCMPKAKIVPASPRWKKTRDRLQEKDIETGEAYTVVDLCEAVEGALLSDYHVKNGHLDAETIFRDSGTVDRHRAKFRGADAMPMPTMPEDLRGEDIAWLLERCDCGHMRMEHSKADPDRNGWAPCLSCNECVDFDDIRQRAEVWKREHVA